MEEIHPRDASPVRLAFRTGYLGDRFFGSQVQADARTVEGDFLAACIRMELFSTPRDGRFQAAGRTDRGVNARAQVFSFSTPYPERAIAALNWQLPHDIWVTGYAPVASSFNPRREAVSRTYRYYFSEPDLDVQGMDRASRLFEGLHDFSLFARVEGKDPERTVSSSRVFVEHGYCVFEVTACTFLLHMVRNMASALLLVGTCAQSEDCIRSRLEGDTSSRISPAAPEGLVLWDVSYGFPFLPLTVDTRTREHFVKRRLYHRRMSLMLDAVWNDGESLK